MEIHQKETKNLQENILNIIENISLNEFIRLFHKLDEMCIQKIVNSQQIHTIQTEILFSLFLKVEPKYKKIILNQKDLYYKLMNLIPNIRRKSILEIVDQDTLKLFISSPYSADFVEKIHTFLTMQPIPAFENLINTLDLSSFYQTHTIIGNKELLKLKLKETFKSAPIDLLMQKIDQGNIDPVKLAKITNEKELFLLIKFNLLTSVHQDMEEITFANGLVLSYDLLLKINEKHTNKLVQSLKKKEKIENEKLLFIAIQLYSIFGFDNAQKIIDDKFTYMTEAAIKRIADTHFKENRRQYRLLNQDKFYYYGLEEDTLNALENKEYRFFKDFFSYSDDHFLTKTINELIEKLDGFEEETKKKIITEYMNQLIIKREKDYNEYHLNRTAKRLQEVKQIPLTNEQLFKLVENVHIHPKLDQSGRVIVNDDLQKVLLGNAKKDNDCLLRLVINQEALGLNNTLYELINKFEVIKSIIEQSKKNLSLYSILDIMDIMKINLYHLSPSEQDITLTTLSKIIKSREFCSESEESILKRVFALHTKRKKKTYSSIPTIRGAYKDIKYEIPNFDEEYLLTAGIDVGNCLKVGGKGEELLQYCLSSPHAVLLYIYDQNNNLYISPIIRAGNGIFINGIDPEPLEEEKENILQATREACKKICEHSKKTNRVHDQNIEFAVITDLHYQQIMVHKNIPSFILEAFIPLDEVVYSDYNKNNKKKYLLYATDTYKMPNYYLSEDCFYQERKSNYQYDYTNTNKQDFDYIQKKINQIAYMDIDNHTKSQKEANTQKRNYKPLVINDYLYIIGNKDWFITIDNKLNIDSHLLPYDYRAKEEYLLAFANIQETIHHLERENFNGVTRKHN